MRRNIPIIFAILGLLSLILCSACVSQPPANQTTQHDAGLTQITEPVHNIGSVDNTVPVSNLRISFEEAKARLADYRINASYANALNGSGNVTPFKYMRRDLDLSANATTVNYLRSRDLDESGDATGWIFGVYNGDKAEFLTYDRTGWTVIANATIPSEAIALDTVVSPDFLFTMNKEMISGNSSPAIPERRDIELQRGMYTLTITSGSTTRTLTFNATTGALIP
jgi:hypothetical protein